MPNENAQNKIQTIRKTFKEAIDEIARYETMQKEVIPRAPSEEAGRPIETSTISYGEALAEYNRLMLIKRMAEKKRR